MDGLFFASFLRKMRSHYYVFLTAFSFLIFGVIWPLFWWKRTQKRTQNVRKIYHLNPWKSSPDSEPDELPLLYPATFIRIHSPISISPYPWPYRIFIPRSISDPYHISWRQENVGKGLLLPSEIMQQPLWQSKGGYEYELELNSCTMFFGEKTLKTALSEAIVGLNVGINVAFQAQNK